MTAPNGGAPRAGVEAGTEAQREQQPAQSNESPEPLPIGIAIRELPDGAFVVTRQGLRWRCADLAAVLALLRRIGGAS